MLTCEDLAVSRRRDASGFTLVEAVMSMLIVGLMLVAALNTIGASKVSQSRNVEQVHGPALAQDLMAEILSQAYEEPDDTPDWGRESSESGGERTDWDDVDDYDGWSASPPETKDGAELPDMEGWGREVAMCYVSVLDPNSLAHVPNGLKRVDVKVTYQGRVVTTLSALRSGGWPAEGDETIGGDTNNANANSNATSNQLNSFFSNLLRQ